jgi:hypothetical protein
MSQDLKSSYPSPELPLCVCAHTLYDHYMGSFVSGCRCKKCACHDFQTPDAATLGPVNVTGI